MVIIIGYVKLPEGISTLSPDKFCRAACDSHSVDDLLATVQLLAASDFPIAV